MQKTKLGDGTREFIDALGPIKAWLSKWVMKRKVLKPAAAVAAVMSFVAVFMTAQSGELKYLWLGILAAIGSAHFATTITYRLQEMKDRQLAVILGVLAVVCWFNAFTVISYDGALTIQVDKNGNYVEQYKYLGVHPKPATHSAVRYTVEPQSGSSDFAVLNAAGDRVPVSVNWTIESDLSYKHSPAELLADSANSLPVREAMKFTEEELKLRAVLFFATVPPGEEPSYVPDFLDEVQTLSGPALSSKRLVLTDVGLEVSKPNHLP